MPRNSSLSSVPLKVKQKLLQEIQAGNSITLDDHVEWLRSRGYDVSRSAIHRFIQKDGLGSLDNPAIPPDAEIRLRCLEVASRLHSIDNVDSLKSAADDLLQYVLDPL